MNSKYIIVLTTHHLVLFKNIKQNFVFTKIISIFATDSDSPYGWRGSDFCGKRTFTNVIFSIWISQIQALEDTQPKRPLWVYCTLPFGLRQYISAWAIELLILVRGNARAQMRDRRSRAPTSFRLITTNRWIWEAISI